MLLYRSHVSHHQIFCLLSKTIVLRIYSHDFVTCITWRWSMFMHTCSYFRGDKGDVLLFGDGETNKPCILWTTFLHIMNYPPLNNEHLSSSLSMTPFVVQQQYISVLHNLRIRNFSISWKISNVHKVFVVNWQQTTSVEYRTSPVFIWSHPNSAIETATHQGSLSLELWKPKQ